MINFNKFMNEKFISSIEKIDQFIDKLFENNTTIEEKINIHFKHYMKIQKADKTFKMSQ